MWYCYEIQSQDTLIGRDKYRKGMQRENSGKQFHGKCVGGKNKTEIGGRQ
jgi:hypothetical protein